LETALTRLPAEHLVVAPGSGGGVFVVVSTVSATRWRRIESGVARSSSASSSVEIGIVTVYPAR
jgi:hypothetical protein